MANNGVRLYSQRKTSLSFKKGNISVVEKGLNIDAQHMKVPQTLIALKSIENLTIRLFLFLPHLLSSLLVTPSEAFRGRQKMKLKADSDAPEQFKVSAAKVKLTESP